MKKYIILIFLFFNSVVIADEHTLLIYDFNVYQECLKPATHAKRVANSRNSNIPKEKIINYIIDLTIYEEEHRTLPYILQAEDVLEQLILVLLIYNSDESPEIIYKEVYKSCLSKFLY